MLDPATIDAVIFDIGGVFLIPHPAPIRRALAEEGIDVRADEAVFHLAHHRGVRAIADAVADGADLDRDGAEIVWTCYDEAYFATLGVGSDDVGRAAAVRARQRRQGVSGVWVHRLQHNIDAFHLLAAGPRPLAIVSNNDGSAPAEMREHGVCQLGPGPLPEVVALVDSTIVGVAKPDPAIFDPVKEALPHIAADHMRYVGDTVHADVRGATDAGMQVVQLDPHDLHTDHDHPRLPDVAALVRLLGGQPRGA